jgi:hypothetical protein
MTEPSSSAREPDVIVARFQDRWRVDCTCGWGCFGSADSGDATRRGARHLYVRHGIYAGGHVGTMAAMGDE